MARKVAECGTRSGYNKHKRLGEPYCDSCKQANTDYYMGKYKNDPEYKERFLQNQYARHKERMATDPEYAAKQKARFHKIYKKKYEENPEFREKLLTASNAWLKSHPEERSEYSLRGGRIRRARKFGNGVEPYTEEEVLNLYGVDCHICNEPIDMEAPRQPGKEGWQKGLHIDHLIPLLHGGPDTLENVRPAHGLCNISKGHKHPETL